MITLTSVFMRVVAVCVCAVVCACGGGPEVDLGRLP